MPLSLKQSGAPFVNNLTLTNANTEYSYVFDTGVKKFQLQARGSNNLKYAFFQGESGTDYWTLKAGGVYYEEHIHGPLTIYVQSPDAGTIVEIQEWVNED